MNAATRRPTPGDPLIFDPDADEPVPLSPAKMETGMVQVMRDAGFDDVYIYAYQIAGLMPTAMNRHLLSDEDVAEFEGAMAR